MLNFVYAEDVCPENQEQPAGRIHILHFLLVRPGRSGYLAAEILVLFFGEVKRFYGGVAGEAEVRVGMVIKTTGEYNEHE